KQKARKQRIEELQTIKYDAADSRVAIALSGRRLGKRVLEAHHLSKAYGDMVLFKNLDFQLDPGDRIGIVGPNGAGKSTFLDVLAGKTAPDSGELEWGSTVELGYFDQRSEDLIANEEKRVEDYIADIAPLILTKDGERVDPFQMLEWFLFPRPEQRTKILSLSGGEKRRLYLLRTLVRQPNVLFLDEPTNDLDVQTLAVLEEFLDNFSGTLVVVSHDRYFLDRNVDFIMSFDDGVLGTRYPSPYQPEQHVTQSERKPEHKPTPKPAPADDTAAKPRKLTWKEARELETLDEKLMLLEEQVENLQEELNNSGSDYQRMTELAAELDATNAELEIVMERWLELSEIAENG
ncbi:MAG: ABC-F family ATP-binding cassette domain-containing protein, partial [Anaerolineales bacterium]|nr:ABC-F family ATP-binding cassette domain-containing protein [Anaerolineales bacterium]